MSKATHTYAILQVSSKTYAEIRALLAKAGYEDQFHDRGVCELIDMHGLALQVLPPQQLEAECQETH